MIKKTTPLVMTLLAILLLAACSPGGTPMNEPQPDLSGSGWTLVTLNGKPTLPGVSVTLNFSDGSLHGSDGCNQYSGSYTQDGENFQAGEDLMSTMMACEEAVMTQAAAFVKALGDAVVVRVKEGGLVLLDGQGAILAAFTQQDNSLAGSSWNVIAINNGQEAVVSLLPGTVISAFFDGEGNLSGTAGCNRYTAGFTQEGSSLSIGPAASTKMYCGEPEGVMEQESAFLQALEKVASLSLDGESLELRDGEGALLVALVRVYSE